MSLIITVINEVFSYIVINYGFYFYKNIYVVMSCGKSSYLQVDKEINKQDERITKYNFKIMVYY